ncbi:helix-turn-helix transcriptional regulator [Vibrio neptunius]|uniref:Helix-turn-helix transcriptional regulator n=1 Tax=Vibrio neptunius TaxID=170651 RepID=A0ABS3A443_9VIBR|nr:AraC family transcriptional regulator [Vibrio neptunius]MBN3494303.1 helix-turn-helix transcriptional regulator [Vibrio neptunius]MBN3516707.1 helix-turn-helix transcriptional regulator [Vibrio neptunius]MBN3550975.1 helix-turn-helix transcriptional regulator [Vibrio neptunius]MBN3579108.1 helix-turn-helix transcriptional regulator [Vibrio neptunius]MCH9872772.1 helix-turn-helix transcriptional regulator [Vibrio neptunius]
MNCVDSKFQSDCSQATSCATSQSLRSPIKPTCQSFGGCLGCQIHTLSGYGGCTAYETQPAEPTCCLRILTVLRGERLLWHNGQDQPLELEPGKSVLILSTDQFNDVFISTEETFVEIADIRFECHYLGKIHHQIQEVLKNRSLEPLADNRPWVFDTSFDIQRFLSQLDINETTHTPETTTPLYTVSQAYQCLSKLLGQLEMIQPNRKTDDSACLSNRTLNKIRKAHSLIEQEPGKNWSIAELCKEVGTNETSFKRGFKLLFNTTFSKLLQQTRMDIAATELEFTDQPIIDIVYKVGYSSPSHFTKLFKQHFGQNPLQYRKCRQRA